MSNRKDINLKNRKVLMLQSNRTSSNSNRLFSSKKYKMILMISFQDIINQHKVKKRRLLHRISNKITMITSINITKGKVNIIMRESTLIMILMLLLISLHKLKSRNKKKKLVLDICPYSNLLKKERQNQSQNQKRKSSKCYSRNLIKTMISKIIINIITRTNITNMTTKIISTIIMVIAIVILGNIRISPIRIIITMVVEEQNQNKLQR